MYSWPKIDTYCTLELFVTMRNDVCFVYCQKKMLQQISNLLFNNWTSCNIVKADSI